MASSSRKPRVGSKSNIMFTNAVYFPNHSVYAGHTPAQLNYSCINLVYYAFAMVTADGHVLLSDSDVDLRLPCDGADGALESLMHLKDQHPHLTVVLSVGGGDSASIFPVVASDPVRRNNFAVSISTIIKTSEWLDGVDLHWVYPSTAEMAADFLALLAEVRMHLADDRYLLTAVLPANKPVLQLFDLVQVAACVDLINLAAYDFYGSWSPRCGHHAQLYALNKDEPSGASAVHYLMSHGVPSKKILFGVPLYGRSFLNTSGPGHRFNGVGGAANMDGIFEYRELPRPGTKEQVDRRVVGAQCVGGDGGFVSYDNPETVETKVEFCRQKSLSGLYYWSSPSDVQDHKRSLVSVGFRALHGG
ncbi:chitinase 18-3 [Niveomyces insectorum RCEF 264]|uniref:chitinase n=1 Tax=Niveomyces insectorum RCEF 264 TaxID=1081102 RepID=A0A167VJJ0_9HYPO|nr:chitinase 18-3 [Niveomyces insectorum RCEF 264]